MKIDIPKEFKKICPRWTKKILKRDTFTRLNSPCKVDKKQLNIQDWSCCVVGEARNLWKENKYKHNNISEMHKGCKTCVKYSRKFASIIDTGRIGETYGLNDNNIIKNDLEAEIKSFVKHMKRCHSNELGGN